jgi:hypothetical protein
MWTNAEQAGRQPNLAFGLNKSSGPSTRDKANIILMIFFDNYIILMICEQDSETLGTTYATG